MEFFPSQENNKINREQIINTFNEKGLENEEVKQILAKYIQERIDEVEKIKTKEEHYRARIINNIENAVLYAEIGYVRAAYDDLLDTLEIAEQAGEDELVKQINLFLDKVEPLL